MSQITELLAFARKQRVLASNMEVTLGRAVSALADAENMEKELAYRQRYGGQHLRLTSTDAELKQSLLSRIGQAERLIAQYNVEATKHDTVLESFQETGLTAQTVSA